MTYYSMNSPTPLFVEERDREEKAIVNSIYFLIISLWFIIYVALIVDLYNSYV